MRKATPAIVALLVSAVLSGCGYTSAGLMPGDVRTVYVEFFDNRTFRRELEVDLTRAVVGEIRRHTRLNFAPKDGADSILRGTITDFEERTTVKSEDDEVLLERVRVKVQFRWQDRLTGADIVPPQEVVESSRVAQGESLRDIPLQEVAQRIVQRMEAPW